MRGTHVLALTVRVEVEEHDIEIVSQLLTAAVEAKIQGFGENVGPHTVTTEAKWGALS